MSEWIKNYGRCPVPDGTEIDVKFESGDEIIGTVVGTFRSKSRTTSSPWPHTWDLGGGDTDVTHWRMHVPASVRKFSEGQRVEKIKGSSWRGRVVGFYSTTLTPFGYCVESEREPGSVQIYPESALREVSDE